MRRRRLLELGAALGGGLGGCLGRGTPPGSGGGATDGSPSPGTASPGGTPTFPDGPKDRPERPEKLTASTAREFVRTYEYRRVYNALWASEHSEVHVSCEVGRVEGADGRYEVVVACRGYSNTGGPATGTGTATVVHADYFTRAYVYVVGEGTLRRRPVEGDGG